MSACLCVLTQKKTCLLAKVVVMALKVQIVHKHWDRAVVQRQLHSNIAPCSVLQHVGRHAQSAHKHYLGQPVLDRVDCIVQTKIAASCLLDRPGRICIDFSRVDRHAALGWMLADGH